MSLTAPSSQQANLPTMSGPMNAREQSRLQAQAQAEAQAQAQAQVQAQIQAQTVLASLNAPPMNNLASQSQAQSQLSTGAMNAMQMPGPSNGRNGGSSVAMGQFSFANGGATSGTTSTGGDGDGDGAGASEVANNASTSAPMQPTGGHRSVLGSGIQSTAVQEAQIQARKKAEVFANARKRKRVEQPVEPVCAEPVPTEDAKLTPEERKRKRYERRLALNRESAAVSRVRRREYVKLLEERLVGAEKERVRLATELEDMQRQHSKLREHLQKLEGDIDRGSN